MLTDGMSGMGVMGDGVIRRGEDMDGQVERPEMRSACRQKPPILLSLISYLQTGAWQADRPRWRQTKRFGGGRERG